MAMIKLPDYLFLLLLLLSLLCLLFCSSSGTGLSLSLMHLHHHHPIPRDLIIPIPIPILSLPLKHSPSLPNKSHPFSHFKLFLRSWFYLFENLKPKDRDTTKQTSTASPSPLRKLLHSVQKPDSITNKTTPITTVPSTNQVPYKAPPTSTVLGQTWCVARPDVSETALQDALDFACGIGGADCTALQFMNSCYNPNTLRAHASYAFNTYYHRNPVPSSCNFSATAMLVNVNPSSLNCTYPSSSVSSYNPMERGAGSDNGLPELNADDSGSSAVGSDIPVTSCSNFSANPAVIAPFIFVFTVVHIRSHI